MEMSIIKWRLTSKIKRLEYTMKILHTNKQRLHFAGFIFDFENMRIEVEDGDEDYVEE